MKSSDPVKVITVRTTSFEAAAETGGTGTVDKGNEAVKICRVSDFDVKNCKYSLNFRYGRKFLYFEAIPKVWFLNVLPSNQS